MTIDTTYLRRRISVLEAGVAWMETHPPQDRTTRDLDRQVCVPELERILEQSGKLLRKRLAAFFATNRQADALAFRDLFRHAAKHCLIEADAAERWLEYRDSRNGEGDEATMKLLRSFIADAKALAAVIEAGDDD